MTTWGWSASLGPGASLSRPTSTWSVGERRRTTGRGHVHGGDEVEAREEEVEREKRRVVVAGAGTGVRLPPQREAAGRTTSSRMSHRDRGEMDVDVDDDDAALPPSPPAASRS